MLRPISEKLANSIYDILIEVCRAHDHDSSRDMFIHFATQDGPGKEYRFGGMFGMAGKVWLQHDQVRVSGPNWRELASEFDRGKESEAAVKEANRQLELLVESDE